MTAKERYKISENLRGQLEGYEKGKAEARKEILDFIEKERDNGNIEGEKGFSASLCLSKLMKELKSELEELK